MAAAARGPGGPAPRAPEAGAPAEAAPAPAGAAPLAPASPKEAAEPPKEDAGVGPVPRGVVQEACELPRSARQVLAIAHGGGWQTVSNSDGVLYESMVCPSPSSFPRGLPLLWANWSVATRPTPPDPRALSVDRPPPSPPHHVPCGSERPPNLRAFGRSICLLCCVE